MKAVSWHKATLALVVALLILAPAPWALAQEARPDDETPSVVRTVAEDPDAKVNEAEQNNPTARLEWQRAGDEHDSKKNAARLQQELVRRLQRLLPLLGRNTHLGESTADASAKFRRPSLARPALGATYGLG